MKMKMLLTGATGHTAQSRLPVLSGKCNKDGISAAFEKTDLNQAPESRNEALISNAVNDGISSYPDIPAPEYLTGMPVIGKYYQTLIK